MVYFLFLKACMRLRMLGKGHTVCFYASNEAHNMISKISDKIGSLEVIKWTISNTLNQTVDSFLNWAIQGLCFLKRNSLYEQFKFDKDSLTYAQEYIEKEILDLKSLYEPDRVEHKISDIIFKKIELLDGYFRKSKTAEEKVKKIQENIQFCVKDIKRFSQLLDVEKEMEFEVEQEEEREIYRPDSITPAKNFIDEDAKYFAKTGQVRNSKAFRKFTESFSISTILDPEIQPNAWTSDILVTRDFTETVIMKNKSDDYLRLPRWVAISNKSNKIVIMSSFETNYLIPTFKNNDNVTLAMLLPRNKKKQDIIIYFSDNDLNIIPTRNLVELSIFSGSLYIEGEEEQNEYISFLGYCPHPRTEQEEEFLNENKILKNGYVPSKFRPEVFSSHPNKELSKFIQDPSSMVQKIISLRNYGIVPVSSHHNVLFTAGRKPLEN